MSNRSTTVLVVLLLAPALILIAATCACAGSAPSSDAYAIGGGQGPVLTMVVPSEPPAVPEPSCLAALCGGIAGLGLLTRRR